MVDCSSLPRYKVVAVSISVGSFDAHITEFLRFARERASSYVCMVNAHMTVEAYRDPEFRTVVENADLATADGMPVVRSLQFFHGLQQERVAGNDVMPALMKAAERDGLSIYFLGGTEATLDRIKTRAARDFPELTIAGTCSPPFHNISEHEEKKIAQAVNESEANIVLVSLGCPKQEKWMARMRGTINAMMVGVGGAFPLYAGIDSRAPLWMRKLSLEWAYRLALEPRRLWKRYLITNSCYIYLYLKTWISGSYKG
jgi:N-acetylglucosaminyldiphosphoundecaprenol N-acetyl-beta-D-mannosaminyltransferase